MKIKIILLVKFVILNALLVSMNHIIALLVIQILTETNLKIAIVTQAFTKTLLIYFVIPVTRLNVKNVLILLKIVLLVKIILTEFILPLANVT